MYRREEKAAGMDGIFSDFLRCVDPKGHNWLLTFLIRSFCQKFGKNEVIAPTETGKPADDPRSYCTISVLDASYMFLERMPLATVTPCLKE